MRRKNFYVCFLYYQGYELLLLLSLRTPLRNCDILLSCGVGYETTALITCSSLCNLILEYNYSYVVYVNIIWCLSTTSIRLLRFRLTCLIPV